LLIVQDIACCIVKDDYVVFLLTFIGENRRIFLPIDSEVISAGQQADSGHSFLNGFVVEAIGLAEEKSFKLLSKGKRC